MIIGICLKNVTFLLNYVIPSVVEESRSIGHEDPSASVGMTIARFMLEEIGIISYDKFINGISASSE